MYLPEGEYRVEVYSTPPQVVPVSLSPTDRLMLTLEKRGDHVTHNEYRARIAHRSCEDVAASIESKVASRDY